ncbi:MAG: hypothetical protein EA423_02300 [Phycisphaerales bacterium]|nr:MAG: hypothetical protein EA423_02300 [Phycisphaerales bacterium]
MIERDLKGKHERIYEAKRDAAGQPERNRAAEAGYPPDNGPEQQVLFLRPAMFRARPMMFLLFWLLLLAGGVGSVYFGLMSRGGQAGQWLWVPSVLVILIAGISLIAWRIRTLGESLRVTNKRTIQRRGLFSKATSEVLHDNIRNITISQSFWERIWRVGTIGIASAGQEGIEIQIASIPAPDKVREVIDLYRPLD